MKGKTMVVVKVQYLAEQMALKMVVWWETTMVKSMAAM